MRYIILRDDDTNALTPPECLEKLYRPWLERDLAVNLAAIPAVRTDAHRLDGLPEGFLIFGGKVPRTDWVPLGSCPRLTDYLQSNSGYHVVQHGYDHSLFEFAARDGRELARRIDEGARLFAEAGLPRSQTFVAPYDRFSRAGLRVAARRFRVVSSGWFELRSLPFRWWPTYVWRKISRRPHWRMDQSLFLTHPGCLLSCFRQRVGMLERIKDTIAGQQLTVLVTHWWEYFPGGRADEDFIGILHRVAAYLAAAADVRVITFGDLANGRVRLH